MIRRVGIIGAGQMGGGIGLVSALRAQRHTVLVDRSPGQLGRCREFLEKLLDKDITKGRLEQGEKEEVLGRMSFSTELEDVKELVIVFDYI